MRTYQSPRYRNRPPSRPELADVEWLRDRYLTKRMTSTEIAAELGVSKPTVLKWLRYYDIARRGPARRLFLTGHEEAVVTDYLAGESLTDVGNRYGVTATCVSKFLASRGIARHPSGVTLRPRQAAAWPTLMRDGWLQREYCDLGKSMVQIAREVGCSTPTVRRALHEKQLQPRRNARPTGARTLSYRQAEQLRDRFKGCALCAREPDLEIHHRDGDRANDTPENLIVLCRDCHAIAEWFIAPVERRLRGNGELTLAA